MDYSHYYHTLTIVTTLIGLCYGDGILTGPHNGAVEGNVVLSTTLLPPEQPHDSITWSVNSTVILTHRRDRPTEISSGYRNRVTLDNSTGSLELRSLTMTDSGLYAVSILPAIGPSLVGTTELHVLEKVSNVVIEANASDVVEFNSSVSLACSFSGSSPSSYHWLNGSSEVTASDNVQLGDGNSKLTLVNVTRYDQGPWRCNVTNVISNDISHPFNITIYYGPEDTVVEVNPPDGQYVAGSTLNLSCFAHSEPVAQYHWFLNGAPLSNEGSKLQLVNIQTNQSGSYICQAFNTKTLIYVSSKPLIISVFERVAGVSVSSSSPTVIERMSVNLTCAASGSIITREWMKDGVPLSPSDRVSFSGDKTTVSINPVNRNDKGVYLCQVSNPVSSQGAKYDMIVYYGPDKVTIKGPLELEDGQKLTLTCLTDSNPTANYSWTVNGTKQPEDSHVFTIEEVQYKDSGTYKCTASNTITGYSEHAVHKLEVKAVGSLSGLSGGAIAGIVFAVLVLVAVSAGLTVYFIKKKDLFKNTSSNGRGTSDRVGHSNGGGQAASEQDLNYADLSHFQKKDGGFVQFGVSTTRLPPTADSTEYSDVRLNTKPPSRTAAIQNSQAKRPPPSLPVPAPQPGVRTGPAPQSGSTPQSGPDPRSSPDPQSGPAPRSGPAPQSGPTPQPGPAPQSGNSSIYSEVQKK